MGWVSLIGARQRRPQIQHALEMGRRSGDRWLLGRVLAIVRGRCRYRGQRLAAILLAAALSAALLVSTAAPAAATPEPRCSPQVLPIAMAGPSAVSVTTSGTLKSWGLNSWGQLGDGGSVGGSATPVEVVDVSGVTAVADGGSHYVALTQGGEVFGWGANDFGQVGIGVSDDRIFTPQKVGGFGDTKTVSVAAGSSHTLALTEDGTVWAWGLNQDGRLGDGSVNNSPVPVQVDGLTDVVAIAAGDFHSLAVKSDGSVWAWGDNSNGALGQGYEDFKAHPFPMRVKTSASTHLGDVTAVSGGVFFTLALTSAGTVYAWGSNFAGKLGVGDFTERHYATQITSFGSVKAVSAGDYHSLALKSDGTAWSWGEGWEGQLGLGVSGPDVKYNSPQEITTLSSVTAVDAGGRSSMAVRSNGTVYTWGDNFWGQLGLGDFTQRDAPTAVSGVSQAKPAKPTKVEAVAGEEVAYLTWDAPESTVTQYVVTPYKNGVAQTPVATESPEVSFGAGSLVEGATYDFEVQAQNCLGASAASEKSNRVVPTGVQLHDEGFSLERQRVNDRHALTTNVFNGNLKLTASDLAITGTGLNVGIERAYSSRADSSGIFGNRWSTTVGTDVHIEELADSDSVYLHTGAGAYLGFAATGGGSYDPPAGIDATLTKLADGTYKLHYHFSDEIWAFDVAGKLQTRTDRNGNQISFTYDANGLLTTLTDTQGRSVDFTYTNGRVTRIDGPLSRIWRYAYDPSGNLTTYTDPEGNDTTYTYDADGNLTSIVTPGDLTSAVGTRKVAFTYDTLSRVTATSWPEADGSPTTSFDYQVLETVVTDSNGGETTYRFDEVGRTEKVVDSLGNRVSTSYTSNSNVKTHSIGQAATTYGYSSVNALTSQSFDTGSQHTLTYGDSTHPHLPTLLEDPQGNQLALAYDTPGNLLSATNDLPADNRVDLSYNPGPSPPRGTVASSEDAMGNTTAYGYDTDGNLTSVDPPAPLGDVDPITYDAVSRIRSMKDGKGNVTSYQYDHLDRITEIAHASGPTYTYEYDGDGNPISMTGPAGATTMEYDERNLLVSRTTPDGHTITYDHDAMGNLRSISEDGHTATYAYSAANLLSSITGPDGAGTHISYDRDYNRTAFRYPNGVSLFSTYDDAKRVTRISAVDEDLNTLTSFEYTYEDPSTGEDTALRQSVTDHDNNTTRYSYDELNRLTRALTKNAAGETIRDEQYVYDGNSNRLEMIVDGDKTVYIYNAANQLINIDGLVAYAYDANGNLTGSSHGEAFRYNTADQTTEIRTVEGVPGNYQYLGPGQAERTEVSLEGVPVSRFTHNPLGISSESVAGAATTYYVRDDRGQILSQHGPAGVHYYLTDGLGSTVGLVDENGEVDATYRYDSFGNLTDSSGLADLTRFRYTGQYLDHTGLYKIGERYYNPDLGRWTQQDPVYDPIDSQQWNRYVYVGNDPINYVDPSGTFSLCNNRYVNDIVSFFSPLWGGRGRDFPGSLSGGAWVASKYGQEYLKHHGSSRLNDIVKWVKRGSLWSTIAGGVTDIGLRTFCD